MRCRLQLLDVPAEVGQAGDDCSSSAVCPARCSCADTIIDCRDRGLTDIPTNIPDSITELLLSLIHI